MRSDSRIRALLECRWRCTDGGAVIAVEERGDESFQWPLFSTLNVATARRVVRDHNEALARKAEA